MGLLYTLFIGIPLCLVLMTVGLLFCVTIIGIPIGLTCFALGFRCVTLNSRTIVVRG